MTTTFLIELNMPDGVSAEELTHTSLDIEDAVEAAGHEVVSVKPWARPTLGRVAPAPPAFGTTGAPPPPPPSLT